jgi:hypothetical protein
MVRFFFGFLSFCLSLTLRPIFAQSDLNDIFQKLTKQKLNEMAGLSNP